MMVKKGVEIAFEYDDGNGDKVGVSFRDGFVDIKYPSKYNENGGTVTLTERLDKKECDELAQLLDDWKSDQIVK